MIWKREKKIPRLISIIILQTNYSTPRKDGEPHPRLKPKKQKKTHQKNIKTPKPSHSCRWRESLKRKKIKLNWEAPIFFAYMDEGMYCTSLNFRETGKPRQKYN